jgi:hypothetical protein
MGRYAIDFAAPPPDHGLPLSIRLASDDLPDTRPDPAWALTEPVQAAFDSSAFGHDDPERLKARGPVAVASALLVLARWGRFAPWRAVREVCQLLIRHLTGDLRGEGLELALGLRRATGGAGLAFEAALAERDALLVGLAKLAPWAGMGPWSAARAMRLSFADYERNRFPGHRRRGTRPAGDDEVWWLILNLDLPQGGMPKERRIAALISETR